MSQDTPTPTTSPLTTIARAESIASSGAIAFPLTVRLTSGGHEEVAALYGCRVLSGETADADRFSILGTAADGTRCAIEQRHIEAAVDCRGQGIEIRSAHFAGHPDYPAPRQDQNGRTLGATARELADGFRRMGLMKETITLHFGVGSNGSVV